MVRPLSLAQHTLFADLIEQGGDGLFDPDFPENGSFLIRPGRSGVSLSSGHVYYQGYRLAADDADRSKRFARYVGRADELSVMDWVAQFQRIKAVRAERATNVRALIGTGMPRPDRITGRLVEALAKAGLFHSDAVLLGDAAYQAYGGLLGVCQSKTLCKAMNDRPIVTMAVRDRDRLGDVLDALRRVDPSFASNPSDTVSSAAATYRSASGAQVAIAIAPITNARIKTPADPARSAGTPGAASGLFRACHQ